jgi:hypothetical protein
MRDTASVTPTDAGSLELRENVRKPGARLSLAR